MVSARSHRDDKELGFLERHSNVYVYVPNLIGYARIVFAVYAFAVARHRPLHTAAAYFLSFVCDELDGRYARRFNQCSTLGSVLDMVTDRVGTTCLLAILCMFYPTAHLAFLMLILLDIFSHWFQMYATLAMGSRSHKDVHSRSWLVRTYYRHRLFMGFCCCCCEALYLLAYLLAWPGPRAWAPLPLPAALTAATGGSVPSVPLLALLAAAMLPGVAVKQLINCVQLRAAAAQLVLYDQQRQD